MSQDDDSTPEAPRNPYESPAASPEAKFSRFSILDLLGLTALVALNFGAWAYEPGAGVLVTIVSVPVAVRSLLVFKRRAKLGLPTSSAQKAAYIGGSLLTAVGVYLLLAIGLFGTLFVGCFALIAANGPQGGSTALWLTALAIGMPIGALWIAIGVVRRRWRRDTDPGD
ncbi:hypothetical protein Pla123a_22180 [Posidoniimonas polymericola]|uniref:Uncharacterized protein n=1 Tax=Posidoniimonas polymericola TaxID=2528002 RepID=A0A5C5YSD7_9BACT|nr:hypothetical protein [Posidoniimonas polymericola]TWT77557.1 hypothetical protein Pla123a_22180 [Posidoniimonas polymericola]